MLYFAFAKANICGQSRATNFIGLNMVKNTKLD